MTSDPETIVELATGGTVTLSVLKRVFLDHAIRAARNTTKQEITAIVAQVRQAKAAAGQGGSQITDQELLALGKAVWFAVRD